MIRKGAFTSMVAVEIGWICKCQLSSTFTFTTDIQYDFLPGFLWIMWLAVAGDSASGIAFIGSCGRYAPFGAYNNSITVYMFSFDFFFILKRCES